MQVQQVYNIVNSLTQQVLGETAIVATDLSNIVDIGTKTFDATSTDNYVRKLVDHIGKMVFVNRPYTGRAPSVVMDGWEYGAVLEKIDCDIPEAESNPTWNLTDGSTYNQDVFNAPTNVTVRFWSKRVTFQVPFSFADEQVKSAFSNVTQLNAFFSMIYTKIETSFTIKLDALIMSTIGNLIAGTLWKDYEDTGYGDASHVRSINLLYMYNQQFGTTLKAAECLHDLDFIKFAALQTKLISQHMKDASVLFNVGGRVRHTPQDMQKIILLDQFAEAANVYLQSDTYHNEFTKLPNADIVSHWQAVGTNGYAFADVSEIHYNITDPDNPTSGSTVEVTCGGILGCIFDRDAVAVNCYNRRVTNHYNGLGEFTNFWYKMDAQYFNDFNENCVVFFVADPTAEGST